MLRSEKVYPIIGKIGDAISVKGYMTSERVRRRWPNLFNETRMKTLPRTLLNKCGYEATVVWVKKSHNRRRKEQ